MRILASVLSLLLITPVAFAVQREDTDEKQTSTTTPHLLVKATVLAAFGAVLYYALRGHSNVPAASLARGFDTRGDSPTSPRAAAAAAAAAGAGASIVAEVVGAELFLRSVTGLQQKLQELRRSPEALGATSRAIARLASNLSYKIEGQVMTIFVLEEALPPALSLTFDEEICVRSVKVMLSEELMCCPPGIFSLALRKNLPTGLFPTGVEKVIFKRKT